MRECSYEHGGNKKNKGEGMKGISYKPQRLARLADVFLFENIKKKKVALLILVTIQNKQWPH